MIILPLTTAHNIVILKFIASLYTLCTVHKLLIGTRLLCLGATIQCKDTFCFLFILFHVTLSCNMFTLSKPCVCVCMYVWWFPVIPLNTLNSWENNGEFYKQWPNLTLCDLFPPQWPCTGSPLYTMLRSRVRPGKRPRPPVTHLCSRTARRTLNLKPKPPPPSAQRHGREELGGGGHGAQATGHQRKPE